MRGCLSRTAFLFASMIPFVILGAEIFAQGGPPLLLDDTGTPGAGQWEINLDTAIEHSALDDKWQVPLIQINCGLHDLDETGTGTPNGVAHEKGFSSRSGFN